MVKVAVTVAARSLLMRFATMALKDPDDDRGLDEAAADDDAAAGICGKVHR